MKMDQWLKNAERPLALYRVRVPMAEQAMQTVQELRMEFELATRMGHPEWVNLEESLRRAREAVQKTLDDAAEREGICDEFLEQILTDRLALRRAAAELCNRYVRTACLNLIPSSERVYLYTLLEWRRVFGDDAAEDGGIANFDMKRGVEILRDNGDALKGVLEEDLEDMFREMAHLQGEAVNRILTESPRLKQFESLRPGEFTADLLLGYAESVAAGRPVAFLVGMIAGRLMSYHEFTGKPIEDALNNTDKDDTLNFIAAHDEASFAEKELGWYFLGNYEREPLSLPDDPYSEPQSFIENLLSADLKMLDRLTSQIANIRDDARYMQENLQPILTTAVEL